MREKQDSSETKQVKVLQIGRVNKSSSIQAPIHADGHTLGLLSDAFRIDSLKKGGSGPSAALSSRKLASYSH